MLPLLRMMSPLGSAHLALVGQFDRIRELLLPLLLLLFHNNPKCAMNRFAMTHSDLTGELLPLLFLLLNTNQKYAMTHRLSLLVPAFDLSYILN